MEVFTSQWTTKTFKNQDDQSMSAYHDAENIDLMMINIEGNEFWFPKENAKEIAETLIQISEN